VHEISCVLGRENVREIIISYICAAWVQKYAGNVDPFLLWKMRTLGFKIDIIYSYKPAIITIIL